MKIDNEVFQARAVYNHLSVQLSHDEFENSEAASNMLQMKKTAKVLTLLFVIFWLPFFIDSHVIQINDDAVVFTFMLTCLKSAVSPFICVCINSEFRSFAMKMKCSVEEN